MCHRAFAFQVVGAGWLNLPTVRAFDGVDRRADLVEVGHYFCEVLSHAVAFCIKVVRYE